MVNGLYDGVIYKVRRTNYGNDEDVLRYLSLLNEYMYSIKKIMYNNYHLCSDKNCKNESILFVKTPCVLQEIPQNNVYEGVNKPKNIVYCSDDNLIFKKDNMYRAGRRHIMLRLRNKNGTLRKFNMVKRLFLHELSHTMCNHITYREAGNHQNDFKNAEKFLIYLSENQPELLEIQNKIESELF